MTNDESSLSDNLHQKLGVRPADKPFNPHREYLGDSVYVDLDQANMIHLYTSNGMGVSNEIFLEPQVLKNLEAWLVRMGWRC